MGRSLSTWQKRNSKFEFKCAPGHQGALCKYIRMSLAEGYKQKTSSWTHTAHLPTIYTMYVKHNEHDFLQIRTVLFQQPQRNAQFIMSCNILVLNMLAVYMLDSQRSIPGRDGNSLFSKASRLALGGPSRLLFSGYQWCFTQAEVVGTWGWPFTPI
jgi:hypothetical protein